MLLGKNSGVAQSVTNNLEIPISEYSKNLIMLLEGYLDAINEKSLILSGKATEKAKITLKYIIYPNNKEFIKDYNSVKYDIGYKTYTIISNYTRCTMQLLGKIAECMFIDRCISNYNINTICINIALLKADVYEEYRDIEYNKYIPFSPSYKYILYRQNGYLIKQPIIQYNPQDTNTDISWAKKESIISQLKVAIPATNYLENAKLQIKVSSDFRNVDLDNRYFLTPIVYFDICNDVELLRQKFPNHYIVSAREISDNFHTELVYYYKILISYISGIIDKLDIEDFDVVKNDNLSYILKASPSKLFGHNDTDVVSKLFREVNNYTMPIVMEG